MGTQDGSISTTYHEKGQKRPKYQVTTIISPSLAQVTISSYRKQTHGLKIVIRAGRRFSEWTQAAPEKADRLRQLISFDEDPLFFAFRMH